MNRFGGSPSHPPFFTSILNRQQSATAQAQDLKQLDQAPDNLGNVVHQILEKLAAIEGFLRQERDRASLQGSPNHHPSLISGGLIGCSDPLLPNSGVPGARQAATPNVFHREGQQLWRIQFNNFLIFFPDRRGVHHLHTLLRYPGRKILALDLMHGAAQAGIPTLEPKDISKYQQLLRETQEEITEAERNSDLGLLQKLREAEDGLLEELCHGRGLNGRARKIDDSNEKARSAVTHAINSVIKTLQKSYPDLGNHLRAFVQTGTECSYKPGPEIYWET